MKQSWEIDETKQSKGTEKMANKITVELDLDAILTATDKQAALYKVVKDDVLSRGNIVKELQEFFIIKLLQEAVVKTFQEKIESHIKSTDVEKLVSQHSHYISSAVHKIVQEKANVLEKPILQYLLSNDYAKKIAEFTESAIKSRISHLLCRNETYDD